MRPATSSTGSHPESKTRQSRTFEQIEVTADGVDWDQDGLLGPSSTWTYLVNDQFLGNNVLRDLSHRPGVAAWAVITLGPLVFLWRGA